jgi:hypothetical protein
VLNVDEEKIAFPLPISSIRLLAAFNFLKISFFSTNNANYAMPILTISNNENSEITLDDSKKVGLK